MYLFLISRHPPSSTLFPYTTLFRSATSRARIWPQSINSRSPASRPEGRATVAPVATSEIGRARLNSSHGYISYAVFCLKKKTVNKVRRIRHGQYQRFVGTGFMLDGK